MSPEVFALILTIIGCTASATWILRSKLSDIETSIDKQSDRLDVVEGRVVFLEAARKRREKKQ